MADVPVIFLTSLTDTDDKIQGFQAGGVDYIAKPLDLAEVLLRVRTHLSLRRLQDALAQSNAELEQRVAARTAELEAEVARRTQSEAEKSLLLEAVRAQSEHLQTMGNQMVAQQSQRRADLSEELDQQVFRDLSRLRGHLDALLEPEFGRLNARRHLKSMDQLLNHLLDATRQVAAHLQEISPEEARFPGQSPPQTERAGAGSAAAHGQPTYHRGDRAVCSTSPRRLCAPIVLVCCRSWTWPMTMICCAMPVNTA